MANADGSVIIKADIDDKQAQKELNALEKKIEALQEKLTNKKSARDTLFNQANNLGAQLDQAKAKLAQMKGGGEFFTSDAIKQQEAAVASMEKEWNAMNDKLDKQNAAIREGEAELDRMKAKAGELGKQLGNTGKNAGKIQEGLDKASQGMEAFTKRVKMLAKRALVFTIIARALASLRDWLADVVAVNGEARDAIAQLKGALLTLAQPLVQIIIPAFTALVKVLATVVSFIANIVSALFGTTAKESANAAKSLNDQKNAYKGVGGAAKSASKQLASFDEINKLSGEGGGGSGIILPDFSTAANFAFVLGIFDWFKLGLTSLLDWLDESTNGRFHELIELAKTYVNDVVEGMKQIFGGLIEFLTGVFTLDWKKAWEGIKEIFRGIWNTIVGTLEAAINLIIKGINWLIDQLNKIHFEIPDWVPGIGGKSFGINISHVNELKIPRLAQGAVIPPNREFMAVLGDQKSGTNIETPLATMVQAFKQALAESGYGGSNEAVLVLDKDVLGKVVYRLNKAEGTRIGVNLSEVQG